MLKLIAKEQMRFLILLIFTIVIQSCTLDNNSVTEYNGNTNDLNFKHCTYHLIFRFCVDDTDSELDDVPKFLISAPQEIVQNYISEYQSKSERLEASYNEYMSSKWRDILSKVFKQQGSGFQHIWDLNFSRSNLSILYRPGRQYNVQADVYPFIYLTATSGGVVVHYDEDNRKKFYNTVYIARYLGLDDATDEEVQYIKSLLISMNLTERSIKHLYSFYAQNGSVYTYPSKNRNAFVSRRGDVFISDALLEDISDNELKILLIHEAAHLLFNADFILKMFSGVYKSKFHNGSFSLASPIFSNFFERSGNQYVRDNHYEVDTFSAFFALKNFNIEVDEYKDFLKDFQNYEKNQVLNIDINNRIHYLNICRSEIENFNKISSNLIVGLGGFIISKGSFEEMIDAHVGLASKECVELRISLMPDNFPGDSYDYLVKYGKENGIPSLKNAIKEMVK